MEGEEEQALSSGRRYGVGDGQGEDGRRRRQRQRLRRRLAAGVLEAGRVAMGVADDGNNQDRKLCEVHTLKYGGFLVRDRYCSPVMQRAAQGT